MQLSFIEILKAILFGIVEGVTEWLPISSTGHMILLNEFVKLDVSPEFWNLFLVVIQLGAILAVVIIYWKTIWPFKRMKKKNGETRIVFRKSVFIMWLKVLVGCIPAAVVGILADDWIDEHLYTPQVVAIMLIVVGIAFIVIETLNTNKVPRVERMRDLTFRDAFVIGLFQLVAAVLPGTSRSGSTILGGLMIGVSRTIASKFTFIMAIPVMAGASLLKIVKAGLHFSAAEWTLLGVGMVVAFIVSIVVIVFLMNYIRKHDFKPFGVYRIILGIAVLVYFNFLKAPVY
ncbi:MAG TPA: undecaprenyl-diphosphatase [Lachnospiraceae bacterium]|nr:undecaprenyl-diphosphatase [Lachnospiraceae bacterium]